MNIWPTHQTGRGERIAVSRLTLPLFYWKIKNCSPIGINGEMCQWVLSRVLVVITSNVVKFFSIIREFNLTIKLKNSAILGPLLSNCIVHVYFHREDTMIVRYHMIPEVTHRFISLSFPVFTSPYCQSSHVMLSPSSASFISTIVQSDFSHMKQTNLLRLLPHKYWRWL